MRSAVGVFFFSLLGCVAASGQSQHFLYICDFTVTVPLPTQVDCYPIDISMMGGLRFEDYKVTNPTAVQFDPAQRLQEVAALGPSTAATLCAAPPPFTTPAPTFTFKSDSVTAQIFHRAPDASFSASEFVYVQFTDFAASNGYSNPTFGFVMDRQALLDGSALPQYSMYVQVGANGFLSNVPGLTNSGTGFRIDPVGNKATFIGSMPASALLRDVILGVLLNAQSILQAAKFTVTSPAPAGKTLWSANEIISLAGQAQPLIQAATGTDVPIGPPFICIPGGFAGYDPCIGRDQISAFTNAMLTWGGEYLGLRTRQSFKVLVSNLLTWAKANAPGIDPDYAASGHSIWLPPLSKPILMVWPTLRDDPALSTIDRETIENWIHSLVAPRPPGGWFSNDLGYFAQSVNMAEAIGRSDHEGFAQGIAQFYGALHQMHSDGSFPLAAVLSACSGVYTDAAISHLVSIAEMAAAQGYDLYSMNVDGKNLDTAIEFLLNARDNPDLLYQYSRAGGGACFEGKPGDPPDFTLVGFSWAEPYIARYPFTATAARLRKILGSNVGTAPFPLVSSGLNVTCAFRKPYEFHPVKGANVAIVDGEGQTVEANEPAPAPLSVLVTDDSGKPLTGVLVSFAVVQGSANLSGPAQVLTDSTGMASAAVTMGPAAGPVTVTATALGVPASFSITVPDSPVRSNTLLGPASHLYK